MRLASSLRLVAVSALSIFCASSVPGPAQNDVVHPLPPLSAGVPLGSPIDVFRGVFALLDDEVFVLPSENYYYFTCPAGGAVLRGDIALFADNRDAGVVTFAYDVDRPEGAFEKEADLTARDGVHLRKLSDADYAVTVGARTVVFHLNGALSTPPRKAGLAPGERFVASTFDDSGLQFFLLYSGSCNRLFWVLNDDAPVPERFVRYGPALVVGARSGFAFYDDAARSRRVLIGVRSASVVRNDAYDGPFDQLPDNEIKAGRVHLRPYLEACYPWAKGKIDEYGIYLRDRNRRIAIMSYRAYTSLDELARLMGGARSFDCALIRP
ncbi:MAG TPA: hypothetical protein VG323_22765 [Thermoanaerobaculia bacterium]|nr:hypothetical protein [Thermoanaerobaculia bacterium]